MKYRAPRDTEKKKDVIGERKKFKQVPLVQTFIQISRSYQHHDHLTRIPQLWLYMDRDYGHTWIPVLTYPSRLHDEQGCLKGRDLFAMSCDPCCWGRIFSDEQTTYHVVGLQHIAVVQIFTRWEVVWAQI